MSLREAPQARRGNLIPDNGNKKIPTVKYSPLLRCPKSADTAFAVADFDRGAKPCSLVRPQDALASLARNDRKRRKPFCFHPISFVTKRDGVDGREKSRENRAFSRTLFDRLSRLLPQTGFPNKDNRGRNEKSERRKLWDQGEGKAQAIAWRSRAEATEKARAFLKVALGAEGGVSRRRRSRAKLNL